jgi:hypothetical protein
MNTWVSAQQAGTNVNVLPIVLPVDEKEPIGVVDNPDWFKLGDGYLQRQVEPTIGASTLNPNHLLAFFNDYRAVDVEDDIGLGESQAAVLALKLASLSFAPILGQTLPDISLPIENSIAALGIREAWIGGSRSYDGGITWSGFFLPGAPWDDSLVSTSTPIYGLDAATDPVLACGPCGTFYLAFVAFTRGGESMMAVARYIDDPNITNGDSLVYDGMTVLEDGNNAEFGYFLDKPDIEVDVFRDAVAAKGKPTPSEPPDPCAHRVYVSYSTFNGLTKDQKIQTKINFGVSEDQGTSFDITKIQQPFNQSQGSAIAVNPVTGTVHLFWRHFFDPDAIVWTKSTNFGNRWAKVKALTGNPDTDPEPLAPFDQPTIGTETPGLSNPFLQIAFRSNGFPTGVVAVSQTPTESATNEITTNATVFAAWQERVDVETGLPYANGSPRIVMMRSLDDGETWTGFDPDPLTDDASGPRRAVDFGRRGEPFDPWLNAPPPAPTMTPTPTPSGATSKSTPVSPTPTPTSTPTPCTLSSTPHDRDSGPQVMPKLSAGGNQLMLAYSESRGLIGTLDGKEAVLPADTYGTPGFISGYQRVLDFRAALLDPATGKRLSPIQVSRYPMGPQANLCDGTQDLEDVALVVFPCDSAEPSAATPPCARRVNRANAPQSAAGTSPFIGDYSDLIPFVQFVPSPEGWRWAFEKADVPSRGFRAVFTDNRHLIPPWDSALDAEIDRYQNYGPPGIGGPCTNAGSRNTDVLTSRIDSELVVSAPTTYKFLNTTRSFPMSVSNRSGEFRYYRLIIENSAQPFASFSPTDATVIQGDVEIFPYSSIAQVVYVISGTSVPIRVDVIEIDSEGGIIPGGQTGSVTFNADQNIVAEQNALPPENFEPEIGDAFVINYDLDNAFVINSGGENAFVINGATDNAFVINAFVINAFVINQTIHDIVDTTWTVTPGSATTSASSYLPLVNIDDAEEFLGDYAFQLIVEKPAVYGSLEGCAAYNATSQQQVLSNVIQDPNAFVINPTPENAFVINPTPENAFVINPFEPNAFVINSTFTMAPADTSTKSRAIGTKEITLDDGLTKADLPNNQVLMTLRAFQLKPDNEITKFYNPDPTAGGASPSAVVMEMSCDPEIENCVSTNAPDLIPECLNPADCPPPEDTPLSVDPCNQVTFPNNGWRLSNVGSNFAQSRDGLMKHGVFLSKDGDLDLDNAVMDPGTYSDPIDFSNQDVLVASVTSIYDPLAPDFDPVTLKPVFKVTLTDDTQYEGFIEGGDPLTQLTPGDLVLVTGPEDDGIIVAEVVSIAGNDPTIPGTWEVRGSVGNILENAFTLLPDGTEEFVGWKFTLPAGVPHEDFYFIMFADYPRKVSEFNEPNNTVVIPIRITPTTSFTGLQPPLLSKDTITPANAGSAVPLTWAYVDVNGALIDTGSDPKPSVMLNGWFGVDEDEVPFDCSNYDRTSDPGFSFDTDEDPGSSGLRYDPLLKQWQFNWQTKWPDGQYEDPEIVAGDKLPAGCYEIEISSAFTCVEKPDGPFLVQLN